MNEFVTTLIKRICMNRRRIVEMIDDTMPLYELKVKLQAEKDKEERLYIMRNTLPDAWDYTFRMFNVVPYDHRFEGF